MTTRQSAFEMIAAVEGAALFLADATAEELRLSDERSLQKDAAIRRLMAAGTYTSVTKAEAFVEFDAEFLKYRESERQAVAARIIAQGKLEAAKLRARLAVELVAIDEQARDPDVEEMQRSTEAKLEHDLEQIDDMLDKAGIIQKGADGLYLGIVERVRLLIDQRADAEVAR
jgi:hypothetical protein